MIREAMIKTNPNAVAEAPIWKSEEFKKLMFSLD
jgi:hypothetical protein